MQTYYNNALINPHFELLDYGTSLINSTNFVATRWKLERAGIAGAITAQPGTTSSNANLEKWLRTRPCIDVVVTAASYTAGVDTGVLRQRVPDVDRAAKQTACLRVVAFGPDTGSFEIALSGTINQRRSKTLVTQGNTSGGTPIWTVQELKEDITELSNNYITAEIFANPADLDATYKIAYAHLEFLVPEQEPSSFKYSPLWLEQQRARQYVWAIPHGYPFEAISTTGIGGSVWVPEGMQATPAIVLGAGVSWNTIVTPGAAFTSASTPLIDASNKGPWGGRITCAGFTGLTTGTRGFIASDRAFLLEAELG